MVARSGCLKIESGKGGRSPFRVFGIHGAGFGERGNHVTFCVDFQSSLGECSSSRSISLLSPLSCQEMASKQERGREREPVPLSLMDIQKDERGKGIGRILVQKAAMTFKFDILTNLKLA